MKKFFQFKGTINGSSFILRTLFTIVLSIPFIGLCIAWISSTVFNYMDGFDFSNADGMSMAESNAIGEEAGRKIAEEMMEIGPMEWLSENISAIWIISIVLSLIPVIWFSLATYYKRVSALFHSNRVKAFIGFMIAEATLDIVGLTSENDAVYWICMLLATGIFAYLVFNNSPIGEHDG